MTETDFQNWLRERGVEDDAIKTIVEDSQTIKAIYSELVSVGAALDHKTWLDDLTSSVRGDNFHQVVWILSGMIGALIALLEDED